MEINKSGFKKFLKAPGKCTLQEIKDTKKFLVNYKNYTDVYREMTNSDPLGKTLESMIDKTNWYIKYLKGE